jgi:protein-S-isoprenylcysteine O-methyltransferase Ste14
MEFIMGIVVSLLLIAVGAVLKFAVTAEFPNWDLQMTGVILMIIGGVGIILSLIFWSTWGGFARRTTVVESHAPDDQRVIRTEREIG